MWINKIEYSAEEKIKRLVNLRVVDSIERLSHRFNFNL